MSIGTTIKRLRRERDITQEQLAECLGISASAVSQWECDKSCPDVSQLPILSNIFNVTTDEILSVNIQNNQKRIEALSKEAMDLFNAGSGTEAESVLRRALTEFPNSCKLMEHLSMILYCKAFSCGADKEQALDESFELAERVMNDCTDIEIKAEAIRTVVNIYIDRGNLADAEKTAKKLPQLTRNDLLASVYKGSKLAELYRNKMIQEPLCNALLYAQLLADLCDDSGRALYTDEEKLAIYRKILDVYKIMFEDEDFDFFSQFLCTTNEKMAYLYSISGDADKTIEHLEEAAKYAIVFETYDWEHVKTSLLFRTLCDGGWVKSSPDEKSCIVTRLLEWMLTDKDLDFVRDDARFVAVCDKLRAVAE